MKAVGTVLAMLLLLGSCADLSFTNQAARPELSGRTPEQAWQRLKDGNERSATDKPVRQDLGLARRRELARGQHPSAVVLACADSRVSPELVFDQGLGDLFVVRVAGNVAEPFMIGSIEYAVEHLHVPLVVVLGHSKCGAVEAALAEGRPAGNLGRLIGEVHVGKDLPAAPEVKLDAAIHNNVRHQAALLPERSRVLRAHVDKKELRIISGVYDLASGKVEWLDGK
jgi:carbonic anhydrase